MRFEEVTNRLGALVSYPGHPHDGLPMNVAIPNLGRMRIWQAIYGGYSWAISFESGLPTWSEEDKIKFIGYTASYRRTDHHNSSQTIRVDGGPWDSFAMAEDACKSLWKQLRALS